MGNSISKWIDVAKTSYNFWNWIFFKVWDVTLGGILQTYCFLNGIFLYVKDNFFFLSLMLALFVIHSLLDIIFRCSIRKFENWGLRDNMLILKQCHLFRKIKTESRAEIYLGPVLVAFVFGLIIIVSTMFYLEKVLYEKIRLIKKTLYQFSCRHYVHLITKLLEYA